MKIEKLSTEQFWPLFRPLRDKLFEDTMFYSARDVRTTLEEKQSKNLGAGMDNRLELNLGLFDSRRKLVGWSACCQVGFSELSMMNSAIFPKYRRKGYYSKLVKRVLVEAKKMGFQLVISKHLATNNAVIIAKLKLGFKITGIELSDEYGTLVRLTYFINAEREQAVNFRSGQIKPTKRLKKLFKIK